MKTATSAGGVVVRRRNNQPEILLIKALGYDDWFLPKGHLQKDESLEAAAIREILQETGLADVEIIKHLGTFDRFAEQGQEMKTHHYFLIRKTGQDVERPEPGHGWIIKWFSYDQLPLFYLPEQEKIVRDSWPEIENLANKY